MINNSFKEYYRIRKFYLKKKIYYIFHRNDKKEVQKKFLKYHSYALNFNDPTHIDEKININKFRDDSALKKLLTDKATVREYVEMKGLSRILITPYYEYKKIKKADFKKYSQDMIIKCSNTSGGGYKYYIGTEVDNWKLKSLNYLVKQNYYKLTREKNYDLLKGKIIAEKILKPDNGILLDYKFFCFNGEIGFIFIEQGVSLNDGKHAEHYKRNIVDENYFEIYGVKETREKSDIKTLLCPSNWKDMCDCAKKLSEGINFVRVDLYSVGGKTYFGEMTFYHGSGNNEFHPESFDLEFAKKIKVV